MMRTLILTCAAIFSAAVPGSPVSAMRSRADNLRTKIQDAALRVALDPKLVEAVVENESGFGKDRVSPKGAAGLMQVMEITARECGIHNRFHAMENLVGACE